MDAGDGRQGDEKVDRSERPSKLPAEPPSSSEFYRPLRNPPCNSGTGRGTILLHAREGPDFPIASRWQRLREFRLQ